METYAKTKSKLAQWWEGLSPKIDEAYQTTKDKANEFGRIGKLKYEIFQMRRVLLKCYQELGETTSTFASENKTFDMSGIENLNEMLSQINDLKTKISTLETEVARLQAEEEK